MPDCNRSQDKIRLRLPYLGYLPVAGGDGAGCLREQEPPQTVYDHWRSWARINWTKAVCSIPKGEVPKRC